MRTITRYVAAGETVRLELPYSEVCMHLRLAGRRMDVTLVGEGLRAGAQILGADGREISFPILPSEAGLYWDGAAGSWYYACELASVESAAVALSA